MVALTISFAARDATAQLERLGQKHPEPDKAAQARAEAIIKSTFQAEYARRTSRDMRDFAFKLFLQGMETNDDAAAKFVLYREASLLAAKAGEVEGAWSVLDQMQREFDAPLARLTRDVLKAATEASVPGSTQKLIAQAALVAADRAIAADDLTVAAEVLAVAEAASEKAKAAALGLEAKSRLRELDEIRRGLEGYRAAMARLNTTRDDPYATLTVANYLCGVKGDWPQGLPFLARSSDEELKALAAKDLASPSDATAQAELAGGWWEQGQKRTGIHRRRMLTRASMWYNAALTRLSGLTLTVAKARVAEVIKEFPELALSGEVSVYNAYAGLWEITYTNTAKRNYVIDPRGTVYQVTHKTAEYGRLIPKDRKFTLRLVGHRSPAVEHIELKNGELQIEHYNPPGKLSCVGIGKQRTLPEMRSGASDYTDDFSPLAGIWFVRYTNGAMRLYVIGPKGSAVGVDDTAVLEGRMRRSGTDVLLDMRDNKLERLKIQEGVLRVEHFDPASNYPAAAPTPLGAGTLLSR